MTLSFAYKRNEDGTVEEQKARSSVQGNKMLPNKNYDSNATISIDLRNKYIKQTLKVYETKTHVISKAIIRRLYKTVGKSTVHDAAKNFQWKRHQSRKQRYSARVAIHGACENRMRERMTRSTFSTDNDSPIKLLETTSE